MPGRFRINLNVKPRISQLRVKTRLWWNQSYRWWKRNDRRHGSIWRLANEVVIGVVLGAALLPVISQVTYPGQYKLSASTLKLVGTTDSKLVKQLTYDSVGQQYQFNKTALQSSDGANPLGAQQSQVGTADGSKSKSLYALDLPQDLSKGVTYHDVDSQLSFSLVPQFKTAEGQLTDGHVVYPLDNDEQAIYTLKNNGLKEDIVVPKVTGDTMRFSYQLNLPKTLAAKIIPDSGGAIGIYSADPALFGNISYGSSADQATVEKARENGDKTYLVFGLPAPVIKTTNGSSPQSATAQFELSGSTLTVVASNLSGIKTPITIDPSVIVTSTSDFQTAGNNQGNIDFTTTSNQITRAGQTGGGISAGFGTTTSFGTARTESAFVIYNNYLYVMGGYNGTTFFNDVQYALLTTGGTIASNSGCGTPWCTTSNFTGTRNGFGATVFDGYLYIGGGWNGSVYANDVQYAQLTSTGAIATNSGCGTAWCTAPSFTGVRGFNSLASYNGYLYVGGGWNGTADLGDVQYAPLHGDGSVGSWTTDSTSYNTQREAPNMTAYDGYMYIAGGYSSQLSSFVATTEYAPINANGTIGTWVVSSSFSTAREESGFSIYDGYMYIAGGYDGSNLNDVQYAPIYAGGGVGPWTTSSSFTNGREDGGGLINNGNGYFYVLGGDGGSGLYYNDVQDAKIDITGNAADYFVSGNTFTTNREGLQTVAYNGYLYVMGGDAGGTNNPVATIYYAPLNVDGSVGSFSLAGSFTTARTFFAAVAYGGYMYVIGGCTQKFSTCSTATNDIATVYDSPIASAGTLGTWTAQTSITTARYGLSAVAYNGTIYVIGGLNATTFENDVQYHTIGASGAISGAWTAATGKTLTSARAYFGAVVYSGVIYVVGGCTAGALTCTTVQNDVQMATITLSSGIGSNLSAAFTTTGNSTFTTARGMLGVGVVNGYMYVTGGWNGTTRYNDLQFAPISSSGGTVGTFTTAVGTTLQNTVSGLSVASADGLLYAAGGYDGSSVHNYVQYLQVNNGGSGLLGVFQNTTALSANRASGASAAYNGYLYVGGGYSGSGYYKDVMFAPINPDGTIGTWSASYQFDPTNGRTGDSMVINNGYIYIIGGYNGSARLNTTLYAPLNPTTGVPGTWATASTTFTNARGYQAAVAYNGYLYIAGGYDGTTYYSDVQYAAFNASTGNLGAWTSTSSFTNGRNYLLMYAYDGYMYMLAGGNASTDFSDVQYASINAGTGAVGTWAYTTSMYDVRTGTVGGIANGYLYMMTGFDGGATDSDDVQYAPINANGTVGAWTFSPSSTGAIPESTSLGTMYNGYMYIIGGNGGGSTYYDQVIYAPVDAMARTASYSKLIDLASPSNSITGISYTGTLPANNLNGNAAISYRTAGYNAVFGSIANNNTLSSVTCANSPASMVRYVLVIITLDDSMGNGTGGAFPDLSSTAANVADFTVNYTPSHPPPNIRLRAGQVLQSGSLSALDTCNS